jgi:DNA-binding response OmpR family regulator
MKQGITVLLFDDDAVFAEKTRDSLGERGMKVLTFRSMQAEAGKELAEEADVCLITLKPPVSCGFTVAGKIKKAFPALPFMFISLVEDIEAKIHAFELGAEDFITRPVQRDELYYRLMVPMRRRQVLAEPGRVMFGSLVFYPFERRLLVKEKEFQLRNKESQILYILLSNIDSYVPRNEMLRKIWQSDTIYTVRSMDVFIARLRKILKNDKTIILENLYGTGFRITTGETKFSRRAET